MSKVEEIAIIFGGIDPSKKLKKQKRKSSLNHCQSNKTLNPSRHPRTRSHSNPFHDLYDIELLRKSMDSMINVKNRQEMCFPNNTTTNKHSHNNNNSNNYIRMNTLTMSRSSNCCSSNSASDNDNDFDISDLEEPINENELIHFGALQIPNLRKMQKPQTQKQQTVISSGNATIDAVFDISDLIDTNNANNDGWQSEEEESYCDSNDERYKNNGNDTDSEDAYLSDSESQSESQYSNATGDGDSDSDDDDGGGGYHVDNGEKAVVVSSNSNGNDNGNDNDGSRDFHGALCDMFPSDTDSDYRTENKTDRTNDAGNRFLDDSDSDSDDSDSNNGNMGISDLLRKFGLFEVSHFDLYCYFLDKLKVCDCKDLLNIDPNLVRKPKNVNCSLKCLMFLGKMCIFISNQTINNAFNVDNENSNDNVRYLYINEWKYLQTNKIGRCYATESVSDSNNKTKRRNAMHWNRKVSLSKYGRECVYKNGNKNGVFNCAILMDKLSQYARFEIEIELNCKLICKITDRLCIYDRNDNYLRSLHGLLLDNSSILHFDVNCVQREVIAIKITHETRYGTTMSNDVCIPNNNGKTQNNNFNNNDKLQLIMFVKQLDGDGLYLIDK